MRWRKWVTYLMLVAFLALAVGILFRPDIFVRPWWRSYLAKVRPDASPFVTGEILIKNCPRNLVVTAAVYQLGAGGVLEGTTAQLRTDSYSVAFYGTAMGQDTRKFALSRMSSDPWGGFYYSHENLPPGEHVVVVKLGDVWATWKQVKLEPDSKLTLDLSVDAGECGALSIKLPTPLNVAATQNDSDSLTITPVELGLEPPPSPNAFECRVDDPKSGKASLKHVIAGRYLVRWRKCEAEVEVKPGEETTVTLMPKP